MKNNAQCMAGIRKSVGIFEQSLDDIPGLQPDELYELMTNEGRLAVYVVRHYDQDSRAFSEDGFGEICEHLRYFREAGEGAIARNSSNSRLTQWLGEVLAALPDPDADEPEVE